MEVPVRVENDLCDADRLIESSTVIYGGLCAQVTGAEFTEVDDQTMVKVFLRYYGFGIPGQGRNDVVVVPRNHTFRTIQVVVDNEGR